MPMNKIGFIHFSSFILLPLKLRAGEATWKCAAPANS